MSPALLAPGLASCLAGVHEATALPRTEAPLWVSLGRGRPQGLAHRGVPSPDQGGGCRGRGMSSGHAAQVPTPCVPSLYTLPQGQIPDLSLPAMGGGQGILKAEQNLSRQTPP